MTFIDMLYRTRCPTWETYDDRQASTKETLQVPGVLTSCFSYYRNSLVGLNAASFRWRRMYNGQSNVPTLGLRGNVDGCMPEVDWELTNPTSFREGLTLEVIPGECWPFPAVGESVVGLGAADCLGQAALCPIG
jgi:hypothetical protein